ncbi:MAG: hypothetical protein ICV60_20670 [Pyrinomonadaceae bacterium]|nr:hypothetical protein [Pyrinomonadaceae bacterium]
MKRYSGVARLVIYLTAAGLFLAMAGCGSLYKVKPVVEAPLPETAGNNAAGGLRLRAAPLLTDEESQELFEANLPLAGLLPIKVEITNQGSAPVELKPARFRLRDGEGVEWKLRSAKDAVSRVLSSDKVTLYNPRSRAEFERAVQSYALDTKRPLAPSERRQGLLFFQTPKKEQVRTPRGLILSIEKLQQPLQVTLN